jgi:hypothetical protein
VLLDIGGISGMEGVLIAEHGLGMAGKGPEGKGIASGLVEKRAWAH